jgi:hypothetical protein
MNKRTKITLRTKIYLTIAGLLALTGILYASNPVQFTGQVPFPTGVAASPDLLLVSEFCSENIDKVDCNGNATLFAQFPGFGSCREKYMTIAPSQSAGAGFTPRDVFAVEGALVFRIDGVGNVTLFAALPGCLASDHNGITFDHFGTYGFDMIVTCREGSVFRVNGAGTATQIASIFPPGTGEIEGPAVVPTPFGPHGGEIWVADEANGAIHTVGLPPTYTVTQNVLSHPEAEGVYVIPNPPCTFCGNWAFALAQQQPPQFVWLYPISDFVGLGGNVILTSESQVDFADTSLVSFNGTQYVKTSFGPRVPFINEGASFVDCAVPTATPTTTPTATFTPTATATATATTTATATATPTPTPTPTVTPTTCGTAFVIGDLDAVVGNHVTFWGAQWWRRNHLSGGTAPASFKGFANCTNPNPPNCGGTWQSDPGNSSHPPDTVPADMTVIVSSSITKSGSIESGDIPMMVTIHTDPGYEPNPGHEGTGTVTAVICQSARPQRPPVARPTLSPR